MFEEVQIESEDGFISPNRSNKLSQWGCAVSVLGGFGEQIKP